MVDDPLQEYEQALAARGEALRDGLNFIVGDYLGIDDIEFFVTGTSSSEPGQHPPELPKHGVLVTHQGTLAAPRDDAFTLGWFLGESLTKRLTDAAGGADPLAAKVDEMAGELADHLATDKYTFERSTGRVSSDLWNDYLGAELPPPITWLVFQIQGLEDGPQDVYLATPRSVLERMFGPAEPVVAPAKAPPPSAPAEAARTSETPQPESASPTPAATDPAAVASAPESPVAAPREIPLGMRRVLRTQVPVIVTLAMQDIETSKLLDIGPGAIIEFERAYNEPLQLSVNNLPVAVGEAVKVGDHFGLKVTGILSPAQRVQLFGGKWKF